MLEIVPSENRRDSASAGQCSSHVILEKLGHRPQLALETQLLELRSSVVLERMLQNPHHLIRRRRHAGNRHDAVPVDFQHLVRAIVHHHVARGRASIPRHQHAVPVLERQDRGRGRELLIMALSARGTKVVALCLQQLKEISLHPHRVT